MKRLKKLAVAILAMVMVLAMNVTAFADELPASEGTTITVTNLSDREASTVSIYKVANLAADGNSWVVADWAKSYVDFTSDKAKADKTAVVDWAGLKTVVTATDSNVTASATKEKAAADTTVKFTNVETGLYLVLATGTKVTYSPMGAVTYKETSTNPYIVANSASVVAKSSTSIIEKAATDKFVSADEDVDFTITTMIPYNKTEFKVTDQMTNLVLNVDSVKVTIGGVEKTASFVADETVVGKYTMDLSAFVAEVGKTVVITYTAKVDGTNGYTNVAWDNINGEEGKTTVEGFTGDATITKKDATTNAVLSGAKFTVKDTDNEDAVLTFVKVSDGVYAYKADGTVTELEATNGTLQVKGLDEGNYAFHETLAPTGYSVNETDVTFEIKADETQNVSVSDKVMVDTKLLALPATGGIGTTIFTVLGCLLMIGAVALFFVNRRKADR